MSHFTIHGGLCPVPLSNPMTLRSVFVNIGCIPSEAWSCHYAKITEAISPIFLTNVVLTFLFFVPGVYVWPSNCCVITHAVLGQICLVSPVLNHWNATFFCMNKTCWERRWQIYFLFYAANLVLYCYCDFLSVRLFHFSFYFIGSVFILFDCRPENRHNHWAWWQRTLPYCGNRHPRHECKQPRS